MIYFEKLKSKFSGNTALWAISILWTSLQPSIANALTGAEALNDLVQKSATTTTTLPTNTTNTTITPTTIYSRGNQITHTSGGREFVWKVSCGGGDCIYGKFIGGEYWVAPKTTGEDVVILSVSPEGEDHGLEINPSSNIKQGLLSCHSKSYDNSLNYSTKLPGIVPTNSSLVKAVRRDSTKSCWGNNVKNNCCVDAYDVLTVLSAPPKINSVTAFRPGFAGNNKTIYYLNQFDLRRIPSISNVSNYKFPTAISDINARWHTPYVDHFMATYGDSARGFAPINVLSDYGAEQNARYLDDVLTVMGPLPIAQKTPGVTGLIQRGIDLYTSYKLGITWPAGAGQQMGRKPPIAFFGALIKDDAIRADIMSMPLSNGNKTQEDGQIRSIPREFGGAGVPIWGDWGYTSCGENPYWGQLFLARNWAGSTLPPDPLGDNKKTCGDPYGWIDGPAGRPGSFYMSCCSTGGFIAYSLAQNLMPQLCTVANDPDLNRYVRRALTTGLQTQPDKCAPPDPRESPSCNPAKTGAPGCIYYKKTWGPDPKTPGSCILNGANGTAQNGRFPHLHGKPIDKISNEGGLAQYLRSTLGNSAFSKCSP